MNVKYWIKNSVIRRLILLFGVLTICIILRNLLWFGPFTSDELPLGRLSPGYQRSNNLLILSSKQRVVVRLDEVTLLDHDDHDEDGQGLHVLVLNPNFKCSSYRVFNTSISGEDIDLLAYLETVPRNRLIVFTAKGDTFHSFGRAAREYIQRMGSSYATGLTAQTSWVFAAIKLNSSRFWSLTEKASPSSNYLSSASLPVISTVIIPDFEFGGAVCEFEPSKNVSIDVRIKRLEFCRSTDGYPDICRCGNSSPIVFNPEPLREGKYVVAGKVIVPVAIVAGSRPFYLKTMLTTLLNTSGVNPSLITVFIDGEHAEPARIASLYGIKAIHHLPAGLTSTARIAQHYKASISAVFALHKNAAFVIILEEDLLVAVDFFSYITQTLPLLEKDPTLYCISAWNDLSPLNQPNATGDPKMLYRIETMPGLGWVLGRSLFEQELVDQWPSSLRRWDWDMWMRTPMIRKDRECIVPDVSRTYHFGAKGRHMNSYFYEHYFQHRRLYSGPLVPFSDIYSMTKNGYEKRIRWILNHAVPVNHSVDPCSPDFILTKPGTVRSVFIKMDTLDDSATWLALCKCLNLWDLDVRGAHGGLWRFHVNGDQAVVVIGVPASPYSSALPAKVLPIDLAKFPAKNM